MKIKKKALITGITGQDGSYLAEFLLNKNYEVHGIKRKASLLNTERIDHLYEDKNKKNKTFHLYYSDLSDPLSLIKIINYVKPDEIYNLAAQSHVAVSFEMPEYTSNVVALGTLRILEAIRSLKIENKTKFYQASTSELFGGSKEIFLNENSPFEPRSPYAISKLYSYWITRNYREAYNIFACNGILFNHESPRRGETFVTRKIVKGLINIKHGLQENLILGNLESRRDWGHAEDYVNAQWLILQHSKAEDFVISTGENYSVREFINLVAKELKIEIQWKGKGIKEVGISNNREIIKISKEYYRPTEVNFLLGDSQKARKILKWKPKKNIRDLIKDMVQADLKKVKKI